MQGTSQHILHAVILTIILFVIMKYLLKQPYSVAMDRSVLIGSLALAYMVLFGHRLPMYMNRNIM